MSQARAVWQTPLAMPESPATTRAIRAPALSVTGDAFAEGVEAIGRERGEGTVDHVDTQAVAIAAAASARRRRLDRRIQQCRLRLRRQWFAGLFHLLGQRELQQPPHAAWMTPGAGLIIGTAACMVFLAGVRYYFRNGSQRYDALGHRG